MISALSNEIAHPMMWRNVSALGDTSVSRPELLKLFRDFTKKYPNSQHAERATETVKILERMVKEDEEHAKKTPKPFDEMTTEEQVAELIHQLRDQNGSQGGWRGSCDIFSDPRDVGLFGEELGKKNRVSGSPASQLVAIGEPALEQLIESVDDDRFTRSIEYHRVIRVGECCLTIMDKIKPTGRRFHIHENSEQVKKAMKIWYLGDKQK